jgi:hypothetical protein
MELYRRKTSAGFRTTFKISGKIRTESENTEGLATLNLDPRSFTGHCRQCSKPYLFLELPP